VWATTIGDSEKQNEKQTNTPVQGEKQNEKQQ